MDVDKELSTPLTMAETSKPTRRQAYIGHMSNAFKSKGKEKEKAWEPSPDVESNKQLACVLQHLHNAGVPKDVEINILQDSVVQIAFKQVLNEFDIIIT